MSTIKKALRRNFRIIRNSYKKSVSFPDENETSLWLTDNFHLLSREYSSLNKTLVKNRPLASSDENSDIVKYCRQLCRNGIVPGDDEIISFFKEREVTLPVLSLLPFFLSFSLLSICADSLKNRNGSVKNVILSLRKIGRIDFERILPEVNETEKLLLKDPAGIYALCTKSTKELYRSSAAKKAKKENKSEYEIVKEAYEKSKNAFEESKRHIGFYLGIEKNRSKTGNALLVSEIISVFILSALASVLCKKIYVGPVLFFPLWAILKTPFNIISEIFTKTTPLPGIELNAEIPPSGFTAIAVSSILPKAPDSDKLKQKLVSLHRSTGEKNTVICLCADLKNGKTPEDDADIPDIKAAKRIIEELNKKYSGGFVLFIRPRIYSPTQREYSGFERKRGAICALCNFIKGYTNEFSVAFGDVENVKKAKYLLAVDYDTEIPFGALEKLVGTALHPLNRAVVSNTEKTVLSGYGIFAPKTETSIESANRTSFSRIMSPSCGINAYNGLTGEKYQDLFSESIFSGKGLIDIDAFCAVIPNKFPTQKILSHDILEGIVLRCAFVGDVSFTDSFPRSLSSFLAREHRWMRGDIQNSVFLKIKKRRVTDFVFPFTQRFRLFDNIRRAVTPISTFGALVLSCFTDGRCAVILSAFALFSAMAGELFSALYSFISGGIRAFSRLYASDSAPNALMSTVRGIVYASIMPYSFLNSADAVIRTVYRMTVSKRNLLEWTAFAVSDKKDSGIINIFKDIFSVVSGVLLIMFSVSPGKTAGLLFLFAPVFRMFSSIEKQTDAKPLTPEQKNKLVSYAGLMWNYFEIYASSRENMLPPDNVQETPVFRISHRTSPTDIGMYAVSCLGARDLKFINTKELCERIGALLSSIDRLEKYRGNLFNWYETASLRTLEPRYISLVDSGNLLCCFTVLRQGLYEYAAEENDIYILIKKLSDFIEKCDISFMYDNKRGLFHIGYDVKNDSLSESYYDLLMSEARMTGYFAAASKRVPVKHWENLGRMMVKDGRYAGPVSWTGTMFEYFMPSLFIPTYKNTLQYEGLKFALRCQKKEGLKRRLPYGVSESGYYAFDRELNYLYKANGVQSLALRRNEENEYTVSPYSSFLALAVDPYDALKNLERLETLGAIGSCGFYEAVDFTRERTLSQDFAFVRSYMAHHVGMSIISCVNALCGRVMQTRFMSCEQNAGAKSLLEEKVPTDVKVMRRTEETNIPRRPARSDDSQRLSLQTDLANITCTCATNSEYSVFTSSAGECLCVFAHRTILKKPSGDPSRPAGVFSAVSENSKVISFTPAGSPENYKNYTFCSQSGKVSFKTESDGLILINESGVHTKFSAGINKYFIKNKKPNGRTIDFFIYIEPSLLKIGDSNSHSAYNSLFLNSQYDKNEKIISFTRTDHDSDCEPSLACAFLENADFVHCEDREQVLPHPYGYSALFGTTADCSSVSPDKCCYIKRRISLKPGEEKRITFVMSAGLSLTSAKNNIIKLRTSKFSRKYAPGMFVPGSLGEIYAQQLLNKTYFSKCRSDRALRAAKKNTNSVDALWSLGISGDVPLICVKMNEQDNYLPPIIKMHSVLSKCGIETEIAVILSENDEYGAPALSKLKKILYAENYIHMLNVKNGIFPVSYSKTNSSVLLTLLACSTLILPETNEKKTHSTVTVNKILPSCKIKSSDNSFMENGFEINRTPPVSWCTALANPSFGTLVSDSSLGFTWAVNSGENKITPWISDSSAENNSEIIAIKTDGKIYDAVKGSNAYFSRNRVSYFSAAGGLHIRTDVTVAPRGMKKTISVSVTNPSDNECAYELMYEINVILSADSKYEKTVKTEIDSTGIIFTNPFNRFFNGYAKLYTDIPSPEIINSGIMFDGIPCTPGHVTLKKKIKLPARKTEMYKFILSFGRTRESAEKIIKINSKERPINKITIDSPDKTLNFIFNNFLPAQIINSRLFGRTGFRQCSGAYGYRDQLQDALGAILLDPSLLRTQILRCASVQFAEGDVFHWFHVLPVKNGIRLFGARTKYSDDLLWLPFCVCKYIFKTGDNKILSVRLPFITGEKLEENETQKCFEASFTKERESLYAHCVRAIEHSLAFGGHSLPLIKGGDWNDSFNAVGTNGRGESVWLAMFLIGILDDFSKISESLNDLKRAEKYKKIRVELIRSVEDFAWEGDRYLRAFYDSGKAMGSKLSDACKLDILPQAFSVLSSMPKSERQKTALDTAYRELFDKENSVVKLFDVPFDKKTLRAGYVNDYPHGIRENAGQYTHAAVWLAEAFFKSGDAERGYEILSAINPAKKKTSVYKNEPFYLSADVYTNEKMYARGGWSLYTGSAGWFYSVTAEDMFGLKPVNGRIVKKPCLPRKFGEDRANISIKSNSGGNAYNPRES